MVVWPEWMGEHGWGISLDIGPASETGVPQRMPVRRIMQGPSLTAASPKLRDVTALAALETPPVPRKEDFPPGAMIVPCHDLARFHQFTYDLMLLDVPDGTIPIMNRSSSIVQNMNMGVEMILESEAEWAWIVGDDHGFKRNIVVQLLAHHRSTWSCRFAPSAARLFRWSSTTRSAARTGPGRPLYNTMQFSDLPTDGKLFEVHAAGTAGMLVKRHVFEALGSPVFRNWDDTVINEDVVFSGG